MKIKIALIPAVLFLFPFLLVFASCGQVPVTAVVLDPFDEKTGSIAQYSFSEDSARLLPAEYCAPVCTSSLLMWLGDNGFSSLTARTNDTEKDQFDLAMKLGSPEYMDSASGTTVNGLCNGLGEYILERGLRYKMLEYWGWQYVDSKFDKAFLPDLDVAKAVLRNQYGFALMTVGYYSYDSNVDEYFRQGGHVIPLTGYGYNGETVSRGYLTTFNPYPMAGMPAVNYIKPVEIQSGLLKSPLTLSPCPASGFYKMPGLQVPEGSDLAIIDGIVILEMWP